MNKPCDCCEGTEVLTLAPPANRPGLDQLHYRLGRHGDFLETMLARLSSHYLEYESDAIDQDGQPVVDRSQPLKGLRIRDPSDPAIALLDAWASLASVLTFYQERVANEGYLRTATERRSILEMGRLVGYRLRPGVASSTYLAFTLEDGYRVDVPIGTRAQNLPVGDARPQPFETVEPLHARSEWNALKPRQTRPQLITVLPAEDGQDPALPPRLSNDTVYLAGVQTNLEANDALLFVFGDGERVLALVESVEVQFAEKRTKVTLQHQGPAEMNLLAAATAAVTRLPNLLDALDKDVAVQPRSSASLPRTPAQAFAQDSGLAGRLIANLRLEIGDTLYRAWRYAPASEPLPLTVYSMRVQARPFGHNAGPRRILDERNRLIAEEDWPLAGTLRLGMLVDRERGQATVSVELEGDSDSFQGELSHSQWETTLLDQFQVTFEVEGNPEGDVSELYVFDWPGLEFKVAVSSPLGDGTQRVEIEHEGQTVAKRIAQGRRISFRRGRLRIRVQEQGEGRLSVAAEMPQAIDCHVLDLDNEYKQVLPGSFVAVQRDAPAPLITTVEGVRAVSRADYDLQATVTQLTLRDCWLTENDGYLSDIRNTTVYAQSEKLELAEAPISEPVCHDAVELDGLYEELDSGRWLVVAGELADIPNTPGVTASELAMIAAVEERTARLPSDDPDNPAQQDAPDERVHTFLTLATPLAHCYKRDTVTIYGNVVRATHGETRSEVLGSGEGSQPFQSFALRQSPLTYVSAPSASGVDSTLKLYVNDVRWHQAESLIELEGGRRGLITTTDDENRTTVTFGDGEHGARLPTGVENVRAVYRAGIGKVGNVPERQISLLLTRPLGVNGVINPLPATGGADPETRDQARGNVPLALKALDRLVSVADYADFARTFAGIGKASAVHLPSGRTGGGQIVHVTIAGADDIPIDDNSDLVRNLRLAFRRYGEPHLPVVIARRELLLLVVAARVQLHPDYLWEAVQPKLRAALLDEFRFDRRELGRGAARSEAVAALQSVEGVSYVDMDLFNYVSEAETRDLDTLRDKMQTLATQEIAGASQGIRARLATVDRSTGRALAAQLAILSPAIPDLIILTELPS